MFSGAAIAMAKKASYVGSMHTFVIMSTACIVIWLIFLFWLNRHGELVTAQTTKFDIFAGGNQVSCDVEGESVTVSSVPNIKCFNCTCRSGIVKCVLPKCAPLKGCLEHEVHQGDECCPKCKGCMKNGTYHESGSQWHDNQDPCKILTCVAGVIAETSTRCYTNCVNPMEPAAGKCCPACPGTGSYLDSTSGACLLGTSVHRSGARFALDNCTQCSCNNSKIYCEKKSCPVLNCNREEQRAIPGQYCCPHCSRGDAYAVETKPTVRPDKWEMNKEEESVTQLKKQRLLLKKKTCVYAEKTYMNEESWNTTTCDTCTCIRGRVHCTAMACPAVKCPVNSIKKVLAGTCCPVCERYSNRAVEGVCTVIDGSHFRTFDRRTYAFTGTCEYQLASDGSTFDVRLEMSALKNSAKFKRVTLGLGDAQIGLQLNRNIKVNDEIVELPYRLNGQLEIAGNNEDVTVTASTGVRVHWSYVGFLEVKLPARYRGTVHGLCGNFNELPDDDFTTREGILVDEAAIFAKSWAAGDSECLGTREYGVRRRKLQKEQRMCSYIGGSVFAKCQKTILAASYYEDCLRDCSADSPQCHCKSFTKYVHDCRLLKINITRWRKTFGC